MQLLAINPGSTSTKIALFEDENQLWENTQRYDLDVIGQFASVTAQEDFRLKKIEKALESKGVTAADLDGVVGRGGLLRPIPGGTYRVNDAMLEDLALASYGSHASNLGAPLALRLATQAGHPENAFIVDPVVVDELIEETRLSGLPEIPRRSVFHALNQKAIARRASNEMGKPYEDMSFVVAHMGGGISVGAHRKGRVIDVNNALDGEGPFSPDRAGSLPTGALVKLCFSGSVTLPEMRKKINGKGGLVAHLGTNDLREVERRIADGDGKADLVFRSMAYQVAKEIGLRSVALDGAVDAILLTGGLAYSDRFVEEIRRRVAFIAPVRVYPGEDELKALAEGALRVLSGQEEPKVYTR
ncbi:MAG: butyrate kinase [Dethiosulfovibrio peptidovorans]|nr:MAG: butyrate kinase [Dethiosulfovibrio peptidovorans]